MKEVYYYECEICGERFENIDVCTRHEWNHNYDKIKNDLILFDENKEEVKPTYYTNISEIYYIIIKSNEAANYLYNWCERDYHDSDFDYSFGTEIIYYDCRAEKWINIDRKIQELKEMKNEFSSWL